jgi:hypothetical protein
MVAFNLRTCGFRLKNPFAIVLEQRYGSDHPHRHSREAVPGQL